VHAATPPDTSDWRCALCPFQVGTRAQTTIGAGFISDDAFRYGNGTGHDEQGPYPAIASEGSVPAEPVALTWRLRDLGIDSRSVAVGLKDFGRWELAASYRESPLRVFDTTATIFTEAAPTFLTLPSSWTKDSSTAGFSNLATSLRRRHIAGDRKVYALEFRHQLRSDVRLSADLRRQERDGIGVLAGANFTNASLLPRSIDYTTDEIDLGIRYTGEQSYAALRAYGSTFSNDNSFLEWENPFTSFPGAEIGRLAQEPDNNFVQLAVNGGYSVGKTTHMTAAVSIGRMAQNERLLPYTSNPNLTAGPLPEFKLDAEVDTTNMAFGLRSRLWSNIDLDVKYRFDERDNQTRSVTWSPVIVDSLLSGRSETNSPYSFQRSVLSGRARARLGSNLEASAGYEHIRTERDFQEVAEQKENTGWGSVHWSPLQLVELVVKAGTSKREIDRFDVSRAQSFGQNPLLRKFNLAHRYRKFGELSLSKSWPAQAVSISTLLSIADDDYSQSVLGLLNSDEWQWSADVSWRLSKRILLYANVGLENMTSEQAGSSGFARPDWFADHDDSFFSYSVGARLDELFANTDLTLNYSHALGRSEIDVSAAPGEPSSFPDLTSDSDTINIELEHRQTKSLEWTFGVHYQRFSSKDWAIQGVGPQTIPQVLTLGASPFNYSVFQFELSLRYLFSQ
jgi:MtrB/PioB family decaheme-associated outer membrane protein